MSTAAVSERSVAATAAPKLAWLDAAARRCLLGPLANLQGGRLTIREPSGLESLPRTPASSSHPSSQLSSDLHAEITVHSPRFYRHAVLGGELSVAESYLRGDWDCPDLTALFRLFLRNLPAADGLNRGLSRIATWFARLYHAAHANSRSGSRRNIHAHYDLGNDFFSLFLDETMCYSSGIFPRDDATLYEASVEKMDRLCRRLDLRPTDHLLEIGTGWGGLAMHAAREYGCRVTTTTISAEQFAFARQRIEQAGLADRVTVLQQDYRDLTAPRGGFDKLVSVEMVEAVGHRYLDEYFRHCQRLLRSDGTFLLQSIVMSDQRHAQYVRSVDFIQRYVFPGGCLPSVGSLMHSVGRASTLRLAHAEDFAAHYARTLREWRLRFESRLADVRSLGYGERFIRLWRYYLCYCEAAFAERCIGVVHLQLDQPGRVPREISC